MMIKGYFGKVRIYRFGETRMRGFHLRVGPTWACFIAEFFKGERAAVRVTLYNIDLEFSAWDPRQL